MNDSNFVLVGGKGNLFRDLGDPNAGLKRGKAILAARIVEVLDGRGLSVRKTASLIQFATAYFSRICNAGLGRFTLDWRIWILAAFDSDARVTIVATAQRDTEAA